MKTIEEIIKYYGFLGNSPQPEDPHLPVCLEVSSYDGGGLGHIITGLQTECISKLNAVKIVDGKTAIVFLNWPKDCKLL